MPDPQENPDRSFTDYQGTNFTTPDAQKPSNWGVPVTIHESGQTHSGIWNGSTAEKTNNSQYWNHELA